MEKYRKNEVGLDTAVTMQMQVCASSLSTADGGRLIQMVDDKKAKGQVFDSLQLDDPTKTLFQILRSFLVARLGAVSLADQGVTLPELLDGLGLDWGLEEGHAVRIPNVQSREQQLSLSDAQKIIDALIRAMSGDGLREALVFQIDGARHYERRGRDQEGRATISFYERKDQTVRHPRLATTRGAKLRHMRARSSLTIGLALVTAGFGLTACDKGKGHGPSTSNSSSATSTTSAGPSPEAAKNAACAAYSSVSADTGTAEETFRNAVNDPKRTENYDSPTSDAADNAAVILAYGGQKLEDSLIPQMPADLAGKLKDFVATLKERTQLYARHRGTDELVPNGEKALAQIQALNTICKSVTGTTTAPSATPGEAPGGSPQQAKTAFCAVYSQEIKKTEAAKKRFAASTKGDANHPDPQWDGPDQWMAGEALDAGIIFKYAAETIESQIATTLPADILQNAKALVKAMRHLSQIYNDQKGTDARAAAFKDEYGPPGNALVASCGG